METISYDAMKLLGTLKLELASLLCQGNADSSNVILLHHSLFFEETWKVIKGQFLSCEGCQKGSFSCSIKW